MKKTLSILLIMMFLILTACSSTDDSKQPSSNTNDKEQTDDKDAGTEKGTEPAEETKPVTLTVMPMSVGISEEDFKLLFTDPVKAKYPNITVELFKGPEGAGLEELIAAKNTPDMMLIWNGAMPSAKQYEMFQDITPYIEAEGVDINRFEPVVLETIRNVSDNGELYGLPFAMQLNALYYNKEIFDKFGVSYPTDGMTWEQVTDLAKKVTGKIDGTQFSGLSPEHLERLSFPLSIVTIDAKTNKASINNDQWKLAFETAYNIYKIPGNEKDKAWAFLDKTGAMVAAMNIFPNLMQMSAEGFTNWDVVQYPSFPGHENTYGMVDAHILTINSTSEHPEEAMKAISVITSDEVQKLSASKTMRVTALTSPEVQNAFGADNPHMKGKNIAGVFKSKPAPAPVFSPFNGDGMGIANQKFDEYLAGKDLNTALREAEEEINKVLAEKQQ
ncbi:ABC transporter substrate-binding protein [Paenibacillus mendelii]|uniref:ABC transporter substrate-binding protein n=1 Tax=Paenibacillus mendelii TaxID=206163 RepID=A0ABV6J2K0_9BACL|nr:extracellular solute-binding protein [Paenibacillus mendelii]MCQ6563932.1 extracellular solute-binding protein [Paenibacillus mendelii]